MLYPGRMVSTPRHRSGNTPGKRVSVNNQDLADRRLKALAMRIEGKTYDQIAKALGVGYKAAWDYVHHDLKVREEELIPAARQLESDRLDRVIELAFRIMDNARAGAEQRLKAADRVIRAVGVRASLFGLNAPVEVQLTERTELDVEIAALMQQVEARNQQVRQEIIDGQIVAGEIESGD